MATPLQKFNGKNFYNNEIIIDYKSKRVDFVPLLPPHKDGSKNHWWMFQYYQQFRLNITVLFIVLLFWIFAFDMLTVYAMGSRHIPVGVPFWLLVGALVLPYIIALLFFVPAFRNNILPKLYPIIVELRHALLFQSKSKKYVFEPQHLHNKKELVLPFINQFVKYEASEDMSDQLERFEVRGKSKFDTGQWEAVWTFKEVPSSGELKVHIF
jgi:hypothetical protein